MLDTTSRVEQILSDLAVLRSSTRFLLLRQKLIQEELGLTQDQLTLVRALTDRVRKEWGESFRDIGLVPPAERGRRSVSQARTNEAELNAILTPAQQIRLQQIGLQSEGSAAFRDPEVAAGLGLTPDQRNRIRVIEDDAAFGWMRGRKDNVDAERRPTDTRLVEVLTTEQASEWRELIGEPIRGILAPFYGSPSARFRSRGATPAP